MAGHPTAPQAPQQLCSGDVCLVLLRIRRLGGGERHLKLSPLALTAGEVHFVLRWLASSSASPCGQAVGARRAPWDLVSAGDNVSGQGQCGRGGWTEQVMQRLHSLPFGDRHLWAEVLVAAAGAFGDFETMRAQV